jgi:5-methylcytosine-specific restriction endonuclease McrA
MAVYRVRLDIIFDDEAEARKAYDMLHKRRGLMRSINKGKDNEENSQIILEQCFHDETSMKPCQILEEWSS